MGNLSRRDALKVIGGGGAALVLAATMPKIVDAIPISNSNSEHSSKQNGNYFKDNDDDQSSINFKDPLVLLIDDGQVFAFQNTTEFVKVDDKLASKLIHIIGGGN